MPGEVKRKFDCETMRIHKALKRPLYFIADVLHCEYTRKELLELFKEFYPSEWRKISERCELAQKKDTHLRRIGKKQRYKLTTAEDFFFDIQVVKNILSHGFRTKHKETYDEAERQAKLADLSAKRAPKITKQEKKQAEYKELMQDIDPYYFDILIAAYHKKGITVEGKMEIFKELKKFNTPQVYDFFYKLNDAERNDQIRDMAFKHIQASGHYVRLRKKFEGKRKSYMTEKTVFYVTPADLAKRLDENTVQSKKCFDVFISHSFKDSLLVKKVIKILNTQGLHCYCDWSSDNDFLRRELVSDYTKEVLKKRIMQSRKILFIRTENSMTGTKLNSRWIEMELDYSQSINKEIYLLNQSSDLPKLPFKLINCDLDKETFTWEV